MQKIGHKIQKYYFQNYQYLMPKKLKKIDMQIESHLFRPRRQFFMIYPRFFDKYWQQNSHFTFFKNKQTFSMISSIMASDTVRTRIFLRSYFQALFTIQIKLIFMYKFMITMEHSLFIRYNKRSPFGPIWLI